jgi:hypothetical protein
MARAPWRSQTSRAGPASRSRRRPGHHLQGLAHALAGNDVEEGRLAQLDREGSRRVSSKTGSPVVFTKSASGRNRVGQRRGAADGRARHRNAASAASATSERAIASVRRRRATRPTGMRHGSRCPRPPPGARPPERGLGGGRPGDPRRSDTAGPGPSRAPSRSPARGRPAGRGARVLGAAGRRFRTASNAAAGVVPANARSPVAIS